MKVLIAGVDATTVLVLREKGVVVEEQALDGADALISWLTDGMCDVGVIHLEESGLGIYAPRELRSKNIPTPLVGVSRGSEERPWSEHRALFLENGGDDLLRAPVNPRELIASLHAVTRRYRGSLLDIVEYRLGEAHVKVNLTTRSVYVNQSLVYLTAHEAALVMLFASAPGRVFSKEMILSHLYSSHPDEEPEMKIIDVFICKTRNKLSGVHPDAAQFIETIWGRGYRLPSGANIHKADAHNAAA